MTVRVKQKHLILIPQHHWLPTAPHPPSLHPLLQPPAPPPLPLIGFRYHCFWKFSKNWKEVGDNMHRKHVVLWFGTEIISPLKGQQRLCTWQWTKIKIHWQLIWPYSCLKEMEHMKYLRIWPFGISFVLIFIARHFESWKKAKNLEFVTTH